MQECREYVPQLLILMLFIKQNFAKKLVSADRTALFLVENRTKELYARVFDMGEAYDEENPKPPPAQKEIRFETVDKCVAWATWWSFGVDVFFICRIQLQRRCQNKNGYCPSGGFMHGIYNTGS